MFAFHPTHPTMFDFLSKLFSGRNETKADSSLAKDPRFSKNEINEKNSSKNAIEKQKQLEQQRQTWKQKLDAAINNEEMVIEMLLSCEFADGRLHAAQHIHSKQGLEQVRDAFKKSDKRVTKLMQNKLDAMADHEKTLLAAQQCLDLARKLLDLDHVMPNHLVDLDTQKQAIKSPPETFVAQFQSLREQLESRMAEQIQLQRCLLDLIAEIERHSQSDEVSDVVLAEAQQQRWQQIFDDCTSHALANSLPKHTVQEAKATLSKYQDKTIILRKIGKSVDVQTSIVSTVDHSETAAEVEHVTHQGKESTPEVEPTPKMTSALADLSVMSAEQFTEALDGLERALQEGSFQQAKYFEKQLREIDLNAAPKYLSRQLKDRLAQARKQFNHLLSWAKWSGDASREELVSTAEGLANLKLDPNEIVDTVTALRSQWKQMEASSGGAPKELWLRFDAACTAAYAPAATHFQQQAEVRKNNVVKAEQKLGEVRGSVDGLIQGDKNWKAIGLAIVQMQQEWKRLGPVDRKEKTRLDQQFSDLIAPLTQIYGAEQELAIQQRHTLIQEAKMVDSSARNAVDQVRALQTQWQAAASHIALEKKLEQELWLEFRQACDAIFDARKQFAASADQERLQHLQQKQTVCDRLEQFSAGDIAALKQFRQQIQAEWQVIGPVPRQEETVLNRRFEKGIGRLQDMLGELELLAKRQRLQEILQLLNVIQKAEAVLSEHVFDEQKWDDLKNEWATQEIPKNRVGRSLQKRWDSLRELSMSSRDDGNAAPRVLLGHAIEVDHLILSIEILLQLESPPQLSQERRKAQLEILQQSMKQGKDQDQVKILVTRLFSLPVAFSSERQQRVQLIAQSTMAILLAS